MSNKKRSSANSTALSRLRQDYLRLKKDPIPYITAEPLPSNILEWHYIVRGPEDSPYLGGFYHGKLKFPPEFPFKPPSIYIITPNGRFKCNTRLCLSISDFHPDTWNPAWSVGTILTGLLSFMLEKSPTLGSIESTDEEKKLFATRSLNYNLKDKVVRELFPTIVSEMEDILRAKNSEVASSSQQLNQDSSSDDSNQGSSDNHEQNNLFNVLATCVVAIGVAAVAFTLKYVLKYAYEEQ